MILVYSREGCAPCKTLKYWLNKKGLEYKEFPIEASDFRIAPTVVVGEQVVSGLDFSVLNRLIFAS